MAQGLRFVLLVQLLFGFVYVHGVVAQTQDALNERYQSQLATVVERLSSFESQHVDARLRVLESNMTEVTWLGRCVATAVVGQLAISVFGRRRESASD